MLKKAISDHGLKEMKPHDKMFSKILSYRQYCVNNTNPDATLKMRVQSAQKTDMLNMILSVLQIIKIDVFTNQYLYD